MLIITNIAALVTFGATKIYELRNRALVDAAAEKARDQELQAIKQAREKDIQAREQDRLDREQLARLTLEQLEEVKKAGNERLQTLVTEVQKVKTVALGSLRANLESIKVSNKYNEKIAKAHESVETLAKIVASPKIPDPIQQMELVTSKEHPLFVENSTAEPEPQAEP